MKLLKTMTYPGFPETGIETITREAARIVLVDEDGMVPMVYAGNNFEKILCKHRFATTEEYESKNTKS